MPPRQRARKRQASRKATPWSKAPRSPNNADAGRVPAIAPPMQPLQQPRVSSGPTRPDLSNAQRRARQAPRLRIRGALPGRGARAATGAPQTRRRPSQRMGTRTTTHMLMYKCTKAGPHAERTINPQACLRNTVHSPVSPYTAPPQYDKNTCEHAPVRATALPPPRATYASRIHATTNAKNPRPSRELLHAQIFRQRI